MTYSKSVFNLRLMQPAVPANTVIGSLCALPAKARKTNIACSHYSQACRGAYRVSQKAVACVRWRRRVAWGASKGKKTVHGREQMCHRLKNIYIFFFRILRREEVLTTLLRERRSAEKIAKSQAALAGLCTADKSWWVVGHRTCIATMLLVW